MAFPSSPIEKQIDPTDGDQNNCSPPTTSGDTIRLGNSGNRTAPDFGWCFARSGPYEYGGKLWGVFVDTLANTIEVWATEDGTTWAEVDAASHPSCLANTGSDESVSGSRTEYGAETVAVSSRLIDNEDAEWFPALYVAYISGSQVWTLGIFNLETEEWETPIASTIDPFDPSGIGTLTMRPNCALEYREVNDDLVLFWNAFDGSDTEAVYRSIITASFGSASTFAGGSSSTRILYGSACCQTSGRCHVLYTDGVNENAYIRSLSAAGSPGSEQTLGSYDSGAFGSQLYGGQVAVRADDTIVATWSRDREASFGDPFQYQINSALGADADNPTYATEIVVDWKTGLEIGPSAVETSDGELYAIWHGTGDTSCIKYSLYDDGTDAWGTPGVLVDLTLVNDGGACEFESFWDSHSAKPVGTSFGLIFNRGTGDFDPDSVADPRGARYDYSLPVWFWGDALAAALNYYGPAGPMEPGVTGGGSYSL